MVPALITLFPVTETLLFVGIIIFIVASLVGSYLGRKIVDKIPQERFRAVVATFILVAWVRMAVIPLIL